MRRYSWKNCEGKDFMCLSIALESGCLGFSSQLVWEISCYPKNIPHVLRYSSKIKPNYWSCFCGHLVYQKKGDGYELQPIFYLDVSQKIGEDWSTFVLVNYRLNISYIFYHLCPYLVDFSALQAFYWQQVS